MRLGGRGHQISAEHGCQGDITCSQADVSEKLAACLLLVELEERIHGDEESLNGLRHHFLPLAAWTLRPKKVRGGSLNPPRSTFRVTNSQKVHSWEKFR
jgi:hypothetical protein